MKLLLHTCCAPCAIYPIEEAKRDNFTVAGFFYNPNIHPYSEYLRRKEESEIYFKSEGLKLISPEYEPGNFFKKTAGNENTPARCSICWGMRLEKTASFAKEKGFDAFTTTLLGSPYQNQASLKSICADIARENNQCFYYKDFRAGFQNAHNLAREKGMYCQNYCGCVFSIVEREERRKAKKECTISASP